MNRILNNFKERQQISERGTKFPGGGGFPVTPDWTRTCRKPRLDIQTKMPDLPSQNLSLINRNLNSKLDSLNKCSKSIAREDVDQNLQI